MSEPITFPDAVAACVEIIGDAVAYPTATRIPNPRPNNFVVMSRVGGTRRNLVVDEAYVAVEAWGATEAEAHDIAQDARAAMHAAVGVATITYGTVYRVDEFAGLAYSPDPESGHHRYVFTITVALRGR